MPKFIQDDDVFINIKATKEFTDREEPRKVFWNTYDKMKIEMATQNAIHVISYYGFGGIGKSALLKKLDEEVKEKAPKSKIEFLDFEKLADSNNNLLDILKVIRQDLKENYNFSFPIFDLVTYVYETKMGKTATKPELNSIFDENKELGFLKDFLTEIPLIGTFTKVIYYADAGRNLLKERLNNNKLRSRLTELESLSADEIKQYLAYYFSIDLKENLKNEKEPFIFFIDTYEKLVNELNQVGDALKNDLWLRSDEGLICRVPNIIWVIAGREKLKWQDLDESWEGTLDQHLLGTLSFQDTSHFLNVAGINEEELIHQIYNLTHGAPIYLDMCVDTYVKLKEKGITPQIEDFGEDTTALIKRFFMYMNDAERDFTTMLAFIEEWDDESIVEISKKMLGTFSATLYNKIKDFSFVINENGHYRIYETIRDITVANASKIEKQRYTEKYRNDIEDKVIEIKKMLEDTTQLADEIKKSQNENKDTIDEIKKLQYTAKPVEIINKKPEEKVILEEKSKLDIYDSKEEYSRLILAMLNDLLSVTSKEAFIEEANYVLEKIDDYEYTFNKSFYSDRLKQILNKFSIYQDEEVYIKLQVKYEINNCIHQRGSEWKYDMWYFRDGKNIVIEAYEKLCKILGENNQKALYPILDIISKRHISDLSNSGNTIHLALMRILEKYNMQNNLYYLKLLSCVNHVEFIKKMDSYRPAKIDTMYIEVLCEANNQMGTWYSEDDFGGYDEGEIEGRRYVNRNIGFLIETLKSMPDLLNSAVVKELMKLPSVCSYFETQESQLFDYIVSIRKDIIGTTDIELIDNYYKLLLEYEHGSSYSTYYNTYNKDREKIKELLIELYERYSEIFGKDSDIVIKFKASLLKLYITTNDEDEDMFSQIEQAIQKFGVSDERTLTIAGEIFDGFKDINEEIELKSKFNREQRYDNFKSMIKYINLILDNYELTEDNRKKLYDFIVKIQKVLESYKTYFYYKHDEVDDFEKYNKTIIDTFIKMDKLMPNQTEVIDNFLDYCKDGLTLGYLWTGSLSNKEFMQEGLEYLVCRLEKNSNIHSYRKMSFILSYLAYKIFEIKKKITYKNNVLDIENLTKYDVYNLEKNYENTYNDEERLKQLLQLVLLRLISHSNEYTSIENILNTYMKYPKYINYNEDMMELSCGFSYSSDMQRYLTDMQNLALYQKELVKLCRRFYGEYDERTLNEEIILVLFKLSFSETGIEELINSITKKARDEETLIEINEVKRIANIVDALRKKEYGENYKKFDDISKIRFLD